VQPMETIFALSSGAPPAGIAIIRISGSQAARGQPLDSGLALWVPGPVTATGEDLAELHLHGGRAVIAAVEAALEAMPGLRRARPGEFTRRAFANGRIDLAEAEGLGDLLAAETEWQRRAAMELSGGAFSRRIEEWRLRLLALAAEVEAALDFGDEDDISGRAGHVGPRAAALAAELADAADAPRAEEVGEVYRVARGGHQNDG